MTRAQQNEKTTAKAAKTKKDLKSLSEGDLDGKELLKLRNRAKMTQQALADAVKLRQSVICEYEKGRRAIPHGNAQKLIAFLRPSEPEKPQVEVPVAKAIPAAEAQGQAVADVVVEAAPTPESTAETPEAEYKLLTLDEVIARPLPTWLIRDILPDDGVSAFLALSGDGKTFLALDAFAAVSLGKPWFGYVTKKTPVVYLVLEGRWGIMLRYRALKQKYGALPDFRTVIGDFDLRVPRQCAALIQAVKAVLPPGCVLVIDTLAQASNGSEENSSKERGELIAAIKRIQRALDGLVVLIAHTPKDGSPTVRGHGNIQADLEAGVLLGREGDIRYWRSLKERDGPESDTHYFRLERRVVGQDEHGDVTSCTIEPVYGHQPATVLKGATALALSALKAACHEEVDGDKAHVDAWEKLFVERYSEKKPGLKGDSYRTAFDRGKKDLLDKGMVLDEGGGCYSPLWPSDMAGQNDAGRESRAA